MRIIRIMIFLTCSILAGCKVGPNFASPASPATSRYTELPMPQKTVSVPSIKAGGKAQRFVIGEAIPAEWWQLFRSPALNELIQRGIANSPSLAAAKSTLEQAQENLNALVGSSLYPSVSLAGGVQRGKIPLAGLGAGSVGGTVNAGGSGMNAMGSANTFNLYNTSVNVSYNLDIFGGSRRQIEALQAQVDYQQYQLQAAYLALTANIVTTAIKVAALNAQIEATQSLITAQTNQLTIINKQLALGGVSKTNVLSQQVQLEQTRSSLPILEKNLAQARNALAVLVGSLPSQSNLPEFKLNQFTLPERLPVSLPSNLVRQRPDIQASEALLHAASAQIGVATANLYPQITLNGSYGSQSMSSQRLFSPEAFAWNIAGQVTQPIFNGGSLRAQRRAAIAGYDVALAQYRQVVLQAFQNVADSLRALEADAQTLRAQTAAETAAKQSLVLTQQQFKLGGASYLALLTANQQYQQANINRIQAQANRYADTAALFQALGGGWWNRGAK